MWMMHWKEIAIGIVVMIAAGVYMDMSWKIDRQKAEILALEKQISDYQTESKRLFEEYEKNIKEYNEKEARVEIVYKDRVKYIQESVDENDSCEDVINSLNVYQF